MLGINFRKQRVGQTISARTLNSPAHQTERLSRLSVASPLEIQWLSGAPLLRLAFSRLASVAKTGGGIPAMSGLVPGKATDVTRYDFDGTTLAAGEVLPATFNISTAVAANTFIIVLWIGPYPFVIVEVCPVIPPPATPGVPGHPPDPSGGIMTTDTGVGPTDPTPDVGGGAAGVTSTPPVAIDPGVSQNPAPPDGPGPILNPVGLPVPGLPLLDTF